MSEFQREDRYIVVKLKKLTHMQEKKLRACLHGEGIQAIESVVVERDWPEYHLVWAMLEHRMAGKPVPDFDLWRRSDELQERLKVADQRADELKQALAGMLFAFDDGVGLDWSESLLDFARRLIQAKEFTPIPEGESFEYDHLRDLQAYFGLSYASWLTLPRVLMQAMPTTWQSRIAELLNEYDDAIKNPPDYGTTVRTTVNGKIVKTPEWMTNYRHPDRSMIAHVMAIKEDPGADLDAN